MANLKHANGRYESHLIPHSSNHLKDTRTVITRPICIKSLERTS